MENETNITELGNRILDEKMRQAYFRFCGGLAQHLVDCGENGIDHSMDMNQNVDLLLRSVTELHVQTHSKDLNIGQAPDLIGQLLCEISVQWKDWYKEPDGEIRSKIDPVKLASVISNLVVWDQAFEKDDNAGLEQPPEQREMLREILDELTSVHKNWQEFLELERKEPDGVSKRKKLVDDLREFSRRGIGMNVSLPEAMVDAMKPASLDKDIEFKEVEINKVLHYIADLTEE